jgi:hypothetical protein
MAETMVLLRKYLRRPQPATAARGAAATGNHPGRRSTEDGRGTRWRAVKRRRYLASS